MTPEIEEIQDRIMGLIKRSIRQLEDMPPSVPYTRQQVQSIESIQKTLLIINNMSQDRKIDNEMDKKDEEELKNILAFTDDGAD